MKAHIVPIGNSKGIRIPKVILAQCNIKEDVDLIMRKGFIIIKPIVREPRKEWAKVFTKMRKYNEDRLLIDDNIDLELEDWEW